MVEGAAAAIGMGDGEGSVVDPVIDGDGDGRVEQAVAAPQLGGPDDAEAAHRTGSLEWAGWVGPVGQRGEVFEVGGEADVLVDEGLEFGDVVGVFLADAFVGAVVAQAGVVVVDGAAAVAAG